MTNFQRVDPDGRELLRSHDKAMEKLPTGTRNSRSMQKASRQLIKAVVRNVSEP